MRIPLLLSLLGLAACVEDTSERRYIAPLEGQTGVPLDMDLMVRAGPLDIPPDYPVPEMLRVLDLDEGGFVEGRVLVEADVVRFRPSESWRPDTRYAWTIDPINPIPHGPELTFPDHLVGTAAFDTSENDLDVLGAAIDPDGRACLVFSRRLRAADDGDLRVTANDIELEDASFELLSEENWTPAYELPDNDPGNDVTCIETSEKLADGTVLRIQWGDHGPWRAELKGDPIEDVVIALRRGNF